MDMVWALITSVLALAAFAAGFWLGRHQGFSAGVSVGSRTTDAQGLDPATPSIPTESG